MDTEFDYVGDMGLLKDTFRTILTLGRCLGRVFEHVIEIERRETTSRRAL